MILDGGHCKVNRSLNFKKQHKIPLFLKSGGLSFIAQVLVLELAVRFSIWYFLRR